MTRPSARLSDPLEAPTYQDVLDEALEETFPASDPISPAVADANVPVSTPRNPIDWRLDHSAAHAVAQRVRAGAGHGRRAAAGTAGAADPDAQLDEIYRALRRGVGRERVSDTNVDALITLAQERGDTQLEILLREWRAPCGDDPHMPTLAS